nr:hypothetical protein [uncultured Flavobacterium sp.]
MNEYQSHYEIKDTKGKVFIFSVNKKDTSRFAPITMDKVSFLEAHKEELICLSFIKGFTPEEVFFQYFGQVRGAPSPKVIYIVDRKSLKRKSKQIIMRRAFLTNVGYSEM